MEKSQFSLAGLIRKSQYTLEELLAQIPAGFKNNGKVKRQRARDVKHNVIYSTQKG